MTLQSSVGDDYGPKEILGSANRNLERSIASLDAVLCRLESGDLSVGPDIQRAIAEMRKTQDTALRERQKVDDDRRKLDLATSDSAIDFDAARASILDSLDRVRRSCGTNPVLE
jgi:hypothetical protein